jgi:serine/threonine protein kinase
MNRIGHQLGNYLLIQLLGSGGFADVYLGRHTLSKLDFVHFQLNNKPSKISAQVKSRGLKPHLDQRGMWEKSHPTDVA